MALETGLSHVKTLAQAAKIEIVDSTGYYSEDNLGGYGGPNPSDVKTIIFTLGNLSCKPDHTISQDNSNPKLPTIEQIMDGQSITIDSFVLGKSSDNLTLKRFSDGVLEIAMHTVLNDSIQVDGDECHYTLRGVGFDALTEFEHVLIGTHLYSINHNFPTMGGTVIYLNEPLKSKPSAAYPVKTAYLKVLIDSFTDDKLVKRITELANPHTIADCGEKDLRSVMRLFIGKQCAEAAFNRKDYHRAAEILSVSKDL